jgi:hypothetical protein
VDTSRDDLIELSDFAWFCLRRSTDGLIDEEYLWEPVAKLRDLYRNRPIRSS